MALINPGNRGNGIGTQLISLTKEKVQMNGFDLLGLMVFADNLLRYPRNNFQ